VQLTPSGVGCSIVVGKGLVDMTPGSLKGCSWWSRTSARRVPCSSSGGLEVGEVQVVGASGLARPGTGRTWTTSGSSSFSDPDGNGWALQQISARD
jgi:hypothetical protein